MNYYRRFPADYANDTRHLNFTEHGAYTLLLDWCYANQRSLPRKREDIYRKMCARSEDERKAIDTILTDFFDRSKTGFTHRRVQKEINHMERISAQASVNGKKGIEIRLAKAKRNLSEGSASQKLEARSYKLEPEEPKIKPRFARPDWIESQVWFDFEEMRKKERHPLTDGARIGIVRELEKLRSGGSDPNAVLQQSINRGWRGVFEIKTGDQNGKRGPVTAQDHINRSIRDAEILGLVSSRKPS